MSLSPRLKKILIASGAIIFLLVVCYVRLTYFLVDTNAGDYDSYIYTAKYFAGDVSAKIDAYRIIKPLAPLLVAKIEPLTHSFDTAFFLEVIIFYILTAFAAYFFFREIFDGSSFWGYAGAALLLLGYPMLESGINGYTETGAFFFFILALYTSLLFYKKPTARTFIITTITIIVGFFWKVYSAFNLVTFILVILFQKSLSRKQKILYLPFFLIPFGIIHGAWQLYVSHHFFYSYAIWYEEGVRPVSSLLSEARDIVFTFGYLLGLAWLFVPIALQHIKKIHPITRNFLIFMTIPLFGIFYWKYVSTRLFNPFAPSLIILSFFGLKNLFNKKYAYVLAIISCIAVNMLWLYLSYSL